MIMMKQFPDYMKSYESLDEDHYKRVVLETYAGKPGDANQFPNSCKTIGCRCRLLFFNGQPSDQRRRNLKARYFCGSHPLGQLGVGKQLLLPHAYFQVGESAQASRYLPSGKKPPRTEVMDGTMEASYG